ncbi:hypothetical protein GCM10011495_22130 [Hymenobacter frigidus]|uniref:Uncharacterized protein n=1 Tax=Hymenobacter frigidus TaxID=1524095 RepID=A0ABQ2A835_9BACT|nr:hypothetical protein GCM10011495_22130 [Hymenobacter frigidus]
MAGNGIAAHFVARELGFIQQRHTQAALAQGQRTGRTGRARTDDGNVVSSNRRKHKPKIGGDAACEKASFGQSQQGFSA